MSVRHLFRQYVTSNAPSITTPDQLRKLTMTNLTLSIGVILLVYGSIASSINGRLFEAVMNGITAIGIAVAIGFQRKYVTSLFPGAIGLSVLIAALLYGTVSGPESAHAYLWFYGLPTVMLFLLGTRSGSVLFGAAFLLLAVLLLVLLPEIGERFPTGFAGHVLLSLSVTFFLTYYVERSRDQTFRKLERKNRRLGAALYEVRLLAEEVRESEMLYRALIEHANDGIVLLRDGNVVLANDSMARMIGYERQDIVGRDYSDFVDPLSVNDLSQFLSSRGEDEIQELHETALIHRDGYSIHVEFSVATVLYLRQPATLALIRDVSTRKRIEDELKHMAYHDAMTGLPNRKAMFEHLESIGNRRLGDNGQVSSLMYLDLNGFKGINDSLGHNAGDMVLCTVATRLREVLRASDEVYRIGGDEFVAIVHLVNGKDDAAAVAGKIEKSVAAPIAYLEHTCVVTTSIGVCLFSAGNDNAEEILQRADRAMFSAKQKQRGFLFAEEV
ncbi:MAG TPA: diguanylate cyclase [Spirochaetia bacterium]|nr:diguanylate cyclase [Spirochaetia bacterium]